MALLGQIRLALRPPNVRGKRGFTTMSKLKAVRPAGRSASGVVVTPFFALQDFAAADETSNAEKRAVQVSIFARFFCRALSSSLFLPPSRPPFKRSSRALGRKKSDNNESSEKMAEI